MAGDWIKWCKGLAKRPEVLHMAELLTKPRHEVAGLLMEFWEWADDNVDLEDESAICPGFVRIASASPALVDAIVGAAGFADAMTAVEWLTIRNGSLTFPKFGRHNGKHAKRRSLDAERKRTNRGKNVRNVSASSADENGTRGEERRGSISSSSLEETNSKRSIPKKKTKSDYPSAFLAWWSAYPLKSGKQEALKAWTRAGKRIRDGTRMSSAQAAAHMHQAAEAFAASDKGRGEFCPHPATWLNQGRYDDDPSAWRDRVSSRKEDRCTADIRSLNFEDDDDKS